MNAIGSIAALRWLREYRAAWLRPDLVAGLTLTAYLLPAGIGDASLAGLAPEAGLYACLFSGLVFWIFCSSKQTVITVTSALSLLIGASVGDLSGNDPARHAALAACVTLLISVIAFAAWLVRAGNAIGFFSETVLVGFKAGLALYLASTQLPKLFGFKGTHGDFWERSSLFRRTSGRHTSGVAARRRHRPDCADRGQALGQEPPGGVRRRRRRYARGSIHGPRCAGRGVAGRGAARPALARPAAREPAGSEPAISDRDGGIRPRCRGNLGDWPDVRSETWQQVRREPGAAGDWRRQSARRNWSRVSGERRDVAVTRQ